MRLRRIDARADTVSPGLATKPLLVRARSICVADLQIDDVVGAERLDDLRLDRQEAVGRLVRDQHAFRPDAERQLPLPALRR